MIKRKKRSTRENGEDQEFKRPPAKILTPEEIKKREESEKRKLEPMTFSIFSVLTDEQKKKIRKI
jgi:hypothetical protein